MADKFGLRVVQSGEDIDYTAPADISYSSEFQSPKVAAPYVGSFVADAKGNGGVRVSHSLNYSPIALGFYSVEGGNWKATDNNIVGIETNKRDFFLRLVTVGDFDPVNTAFAGKTIRFKVWLLLDPAQEII